MIPGRHSSLSHHWRLTNLKELLPVKGLATPPRSQQLEAPTPSQQVFIMVFSNFFLCYSRICAKVVTFSLFLIEKDCSDVSVCEFPDRHARGHGSGPTETGSALGPDWHEGIVLRGAEQVRLYVHLCR